MFGHDNSFWAAVGGAVFVRLLTSEYEGPLAKRLLRGGTTAFVAVFCAITFTKPILSMSNLPADVWTIPVAALLALTGEGLTRVLIKMTGDFEGLLGVIRAWRGK